MNSPFPRDPQAVPLDRFFALGLSRETAARFIGVSPNTFDGLVREGLMPKPRRVRRRKLWDRRELETAFDALPHDGADSGDDVNEWDRRP